MLRKLLNLCHFVDFLNYRAKSKDKTKLFPSEVVVLYLLMLCKSSLSTRRDRKKSFLHIYVFVVYFLESNKGLILSSSGQLDISRVSAANE